MHVYFVRHGQTDLNVRSVHQSPGTPLNSEGYDEARSVAEYLRPMNATLLLSSTYERALQTARIIGFSTRLIPRFTELFREVERPSMLTESSLYSMRALWFLFLSVLFRNDTKWRYKDAENFSDVYIRAQRSLHFIESHVEAHDSMIIVSHSVYINLMISYMCRDQKLSLFELVRILLNINQLKNCDVVHLEYIGPTAKGTCAWILHS